MKLLLGCLFLSGIFGRQISEPYQLTQNSCPVQEWHAPYGSPLAASYASIFNSSGNEIEEDEEEKELQKAHTWVSKEDIEKAQEKYETAIRAWSSPSKDELVIKLLGDDYLKDIEQEKAAHNQEIEKFKKTYFKKINLFFQMSAQSPSLRDLVLAPLIDEHSTGLIYISKIHEQEKKELKERLTLQGVRKKTIRMRLDHLNRLHRKTLMKLARTHVSDIYFALDEHFKDWEEENS
jgi:hypothetical protein